MSVQPVFKSIQTIGCTQPAKLHFNVFFVLSVQKGCTSWIFISLSAVFVFLHYAGEKKRGELSAAVCNQPWATEWLIYDGTGSCGMQQHSADKKPLYPCLSAPRCWSWLPFISRCLIFRSPYLISVLIPQVLYLPCYFLFFFVVSRLCFWEYETMLYWYFYKANIKAGGFNFSLLFL